MTRDEAINGLIWIKHANKLNAVLIEALDLAIESLSADKQKYETFCGIPMEEAYKIVRGYSLGEYVEVVRCKNCQHHGMSDCPMCEGAITEDYMWCSYGKRKE